MPTRGGRQTNPRVPQPRAGVPVDPTGGRGTVGPGRQTGRQQARSKGQKRAMAGMRNRRGARGY